LKDVSLVGHPVYSHRLAVNEKLFNLRYIFSYPWQLTTGFVFSYDLR